MTDITSLPKAGADQVRERQRLVACAELLFFAYRDFTGDPDAMLEQYGFGRAHHRVLHFVNRNPGLRVAHLLEILKITKQSLARVLKQLIGEGFVAQRAGEADRRERLLYLTPKGTRLAEKLTALQLKRIAEALRTAGPDAEAAARLFLLGLIGEPDRGRVEALIAGGGAHGMAPWGKGDAAPGASAACASVAAKTLARGRR
jgi:DNA-binding MarR family transcriptional regulator